MTNDVRITDPFFRAAAQAPSRLAVVCGATSITYGALAARAQAGCSGRRLRLVAHNSVDTIATFLTAAAAGVEIELIDPAWRVMPPDPPASNANSFLIVYTSGTTGTPKAISRTHQSWLTSFAASALELRTSAESRVMAPGPFAHGLTLYAAVETLAAGGTVHLLPRFDAGTSFMGINTIAAVPTLVDVLIERRAPVGDIRRVITAGSKLSSQLRQRISAVFPNAEVIEYYGASELSFVTVARSSESVPADSVGRPFHGVAIDVRDGVVWVKSDMVSLGYLGAGDGAGFRRDGDWATVGDRGVRDANGFLTLLGREGDMIVTAGINVYPSEVEAVIEAHPDVVAAAVFGTDHPRWGHVVTAAVVMRPGVRLDQSELIAHGRAHLPRAKVARRWIEVPALPRTSSGKVDRRALLEAVS